MMIRALIAAAVVCTAVLMPFDVDASTAPQLIVLTRVVRAGERVRVRLEAPQRRPGTLHVYVMLDDSEFINCPVTDPNPDGTAIELDLYYNTMIGERVFERPGSYAIKAQWIAKGPEGETQAGEVVTALTVRQPLRGDRRAFAALKGGGQSLATFLGGGGGMGCTDARVYAEGRRRAARLARAYPRSSYGRTARAALRTARRCIRASWHAHPAFGGDDQKVPDEIGTYPDAELNMSAQGDCSHTWAFIACDPFADVISWYRIELEKRGWSVQDVFWDREGGVVVAWNKNPERKLYVGAGTEWCGVTAITISIQDNDALRKKDKH